MIANTHQVGGTFLLMSLLFFGNSFADAQGSAHNGEIVNIELFSPWDRTDEKVSYDKIKAAKSSFSLLEYRWSCSRGINMSYGNVFGDNWDILGLQGTQSRMIDLGNASWSDKIEIPHIVPFRALAPGEKRHIAINTSGGDGADGRPGLNGDGSSAPYTPRQGRENYGDKPVEQQVSSKTQSLTGELFVDNYNPFLEARKGHMYAIRVLEDGVDQYFLMRVNDVIRGQKVSLTIRRIPSPSKKAIF